MVRFVPCGVREYRQGAIDRERERERERESQRRPIKGRRTITVYVLRIKSRKHLEQVLGAKRGQISP